MAAKIFAITFALTLYLTLALHAHAELDAPRPPADINVHSDDSLPPYHSFRKITRVWVCGQTDTEIFTIAVNEISYINQSRKQFLDEVIIQINKVGLREALVMRITERGYLYYALDQGSPKFQPTELKYDNFSEKFAEISNKRYTPRFLYSKDWTGICKRIPDY